jgi:poly(3-hydroxybutyrate) depolymerase
MITYLIIKLQYPMRSITKTLVLATGMLLFCSVAFSQQVAKSFPYPASPDGLIGFLQFTPPDYGTQKHPLIVFLHGIGERGNGTSQINSVANNGVPYYCAHGATMRFTSGGVTSSFVVLSPQLSVQLGYWPTYYVKEMINYAKANLQIDTNRIYVTGLSLGGGGIWRLITDTYNFDHTFDGTIAAAAPVCGTQEETDADFCTTIGTNHLPVWAFHSMDDGTVGVGATQHAEILGNICGINSPALKFTYYQTGGHAGAWINAFDTGHITRTVSGGSSFTANPNLYEWFLGNTRATAPVADPGPSQTISTTSTILNSTGSYSPNGSITGYSWQQVSGPSAATIINAGSATATITNMQANSSYSFQLTVTDVVGASGSAVTGVTVMAALPVEFAYIKAKRNGSENVLQWGTASEQNSDYFIIERSDDGKRFTTAGNIPAAGNSSIAKDYTYTDMKTSASDTYYRVKEVDKDGKFKYTQVVLVSGGSRNAGVQMYPNPVQDNLDIVLNSGIKGSGRIVVYELTGRALREQAIEKNDRILDAVVNMSNLAAGLYIVEVKIGDYKISQRVMKK